MQQTRFIARFSGSAHAMAAFLIEATDEEAVPTANNPHEWRFWVAFDLTRFVPYPSFENKVLVTRYGRFCARAFDAAPTVDLVADYDMHLRSVLAMLFSPDHDAEKPLLPRTLNEGRDRFLQFAREHEPPFEPREVAAAYRANQAACGHGSPAEWIRAHWTSEIDGDEAGVTENVSRDAAGAVVGFKFEHEARDGFPLRLFETVARRHPEVRIEAEYYPIAPDGKQCGSLETWSANLPAPKAHAAAPGMG
jgi:hypothetical protein